MPSKNLTKRHLWYLQYYQKNKAKYYLAVKKSRPKYIKRLKQEVIKKLGEKCIKCGFLDIRALQIDHINGGGSKEKRKRKNNIVRLYLDVIEDINKKYQLLCANCNWIKKYENNER